MGKEPTLKGFRDFCAGMPTRRRYSFFSTTACACAQYAKSIGKADEWFEIMHVPYREFCASPWYSMNMIAGTRPHTFRSLTTRLDEALAEQEDA